MTKNPLVFVDCPAEGFLPAIMIGYEIAATETSPEIENPDRLFTHVYHQMGGMLNNQTSVVGYVLRLWANVDRTKSHPEKFLRLFHLMAEDPDEKALKKEYPKLDLVYTCGESYDFKDLVRLAEFISEYIDLPEIESGHEAIIRYVKSDPLKFFAGWRIWRGIEGPIGAIEDDTVHMFTQDEDESFNASRFMELWNYLGYALVESGNLNKEASYPRIFLIWRNCD